MVIKTANHKRKELDDEIASTTTAFSRAVIFSPRVPNDVVHWGDCQSRLQNILKSCTSASLYRDDPFLEDVATIAAHPELKTLQAHLSRNVAQAKQAQSSIVQEISHLTKRFQDESSTISSLEEKFQTLSMQSNDLSQQCAVLQEQIHQVTHQVETYRARIGAAEETVELARRERGLQVPRLQQQISLYATMTGIKWDYDAENEVDRDHLVLVGEVKIPSENTIRRFRIDCGDDFSTAQKHRTKFVIANQLWNLMEGKKVESFDKVSITLL